MSFTSIINVASETCVHYCVMKHATNDPQILKPKLIQGDRILSTGGDFISNGPLKSAIACV